MANEVRYTQYLINKSYQLSSAQALHRMRTDSWPRFQKPLSGAAFGGCLSVLRLRTRFKTDQPTLRDAQERRVFTCRLRYHRGVVGRRSWASRSAGLCMARFHYSGVPLVLVNGSAYTVSVERRNNTIGYIPNNCVLICRCRVSYFIG